uniref:Uncharacterized protein n=1 Tax=Anopheles atroparvus TaxID=41427 RepID=A0AAG5DP40_ANOAO
MTETGIATIKLDFSSLPAKPPPGDVIDFIYKKIELSNEQIVRIHIKSSSPTVHVELKDQSVALEVVERHDGRQSFTFKEKSYNIPISMDDGSKIVKIHDLSAKVKNAKIANYMREYGEVISVTEGVWSENFPCAGLPNGFRYVRLIIKKDIPSYLRIQGETTLATHRGQQQTCRKCERAVHYGMSCLENRKLTSQRANLNERLTSPYASITATAHMDERRKSEEKETAIVDNKT